MIVIARNVRVWGRVQGVFYRATIRKWCIEHDVVGWIKNEPDGSVLMHIEGDEAVIEQCLTVAKQGSTHTHVEHITIQQAPLEHPSTFVVIVD